jgi:predicted nucleic acid-binding protein
VIYLDSSIVLAKLLAEPRSAPDALWKQQLVSSRLLEYEVWNRIHARRLTHRLNKQVHELMDLIQFVELTPHVLARALEPFPVGLRTLDTLHLASMDHLRSLRHEVVLASFDRRFLSAAQALQFSSHPF